MADIFLSYASEDRERERPLVERLVEHGVVSVVGREIPPGMDWEGMIKAGPGRDHANGRGVDRAFSGVEVGSLRSGKRRRPPGIRTGGAR